LLFFFTKVDIIIVNFVADHVVRLTQTAFMHGRYILDGVVNFHEMIHKLHRKKLNGVVLKIDFEKVVFSSTNSRNEIFF
jgi:hypothetical protein